MKNKLNEKVRARINKWFKNQCKYCSVNGKVQGYLVTRNQEQKLKKEIWRLVEFIQKENER